MRIKITFLIALSTAIIALNLSAQTPINTPDNIGTGNCLNFDGTNDFVNIPNTASLDFGGGDFTIEAWVFLNNLVEGSILSCAENFSGVGYDLRIRGGRIGFHVGCPSAAAPCSNQDSGISSNTFQVGEWTMVTGVRSGTNITLYRNGEQVATGTLLASTQTLTAGRDVRIGRSHSDIDGNGFYIDGQVDEARVWNRALTQTEIRDNMCSQLQGNETGLIGYWNMNEGTGNTVGDLTVNGNNGTRQ